MKDKLLEIIETYYRGWFCPKCKTPYMTKGDGKCECGGKLVFGEDVALGMFKQEIDRAEKRGVKKERSKIFRFMEGYTR